MLFTFGETNIYILGAFGRIVFFLVGKFLREAEEQNDQLLLK